MKKHQLQLCFGGLLAILVILSACNWGGQTVTEPAVSKDTLKFHYVNFKQRAKDCGSKPDSGCTVVLITYPVFDDAPALNEQVLQSLTNRSAINKSADSVLMNHANEFFRDYEKDSSARIRKAYYQEMKKVQVVRQDAGFVGLQMDAYTYSGGAHGMRLTNFINWDTNAQNKIGLRDILEDNYKEILDTIGQSIFRKQEHLKPNASLADGYFFKDNRFSLNNNFLITPVGLKFLFNVYEIKPYAAGQTSLIITYADLKKIMKPNTVIAQYIK